jgi:histidinol-phosphate aminotransferase
MKTTLSRRNWFKSSFALGAGLALTPAMLDSLMAAPVSNAERIHGIDPVGPNKLIKLGSNENPYGPSEKARKAILDVMNQSNRYPFTEMGEMRNIIAQKEGVTADHILLSAGSGELLCLAGLSVGLEGGAVTSAFPVFRVLMDYAAKFNARWDKVDLDDTLTHNLEGLAAAVKSDTKILFLVNPNNPTGTVLNRDKLKAFCIEMSKKTLVFSDEAYLEFLEPAEQNSMVELVKQGHHVVVSRTFSKIYGLAGLRVGYLVGKPELIQKMQKYQTGTIISQPALAAVKASLGDDEFMAYTRKMNAAARQHLFTYLDSKKWFYGKSQANVVFFPAPKPGKEILEETEKRGYQIRVWDYQGKEWCRVSIGTLEEMKGFTKAFDEVVS